MVEQAANAATRMPIANFTYRGLGTSPTLEQFHNSYRASASYVTGAHNMKFGYQGAYLVHYQWTNAYGPQMQYRFNGGIPNQVTIRETQAQSNRVMFHAFYAQDQWSVGRFTLQARSGSTARGAGTRPGRAASGSAQLRLQARRPGGDWPGVAPSAVRCPGAARQRDGVRRHLAARRRRL